ncbi:MAG TPA: hypothetical protein PKE21_15650 [Flavobacteriales bacterium]|nr:hypothetical protein [Flavobacteriales bacterium]HMR28917.1 hypothetical protein [Flavobacteriales bacterium]
MEFIHKVSLRSKFLGEIFVGERAVKWHGHDAGFLEPGREEEETKGRGITAACRKAPWVALQQAAGR